MIADFVVPLLHELEAPGVALWAGGALVLASILRLVSATLRLLSQYRVLRLQDLVLRRAQDHLELRRMELDRDLVRSRIERDDAASLRYRRAADLLSNLAVRDALSEIEHEDEDARHLDGARSKRGENR